MLSRLTMLHHGCFGATSHRSGASALHHKAAISYGTLPSLLLQPLPDEFLIDTLKKVRSGQGQARIPPWDWSMGTTCLVPRSRTGQSKTHDAQRHAGPSLNIARIAWAKRTVLEQRVVEVGAYLPCRLRHGSHQRRREVSRRLRAAPDTGLSLDLRVSSSACQPPLLAGVTLLRDLKTSSAIVRSSWTEAGGRKLLSRGHV